MQFTTTSEPFDYKLNELHLDLNQTLLYSKLEIDEFAVGVTYNRQCWLGDVPFESKERTLYTVRTVRTVRSI